MARQSVLKVKAAWTPSIEQVEKMVGIGWPLARTAKVRVVKVGKVTLHASIPFDAGDSTSFTEAQSIAADLQAAVGSGAEFSTEISTEEKAAPVTVGFEGDSTD